MTTKYGEGLDPSKNPSPYGALAEPDAAEVERILAESAEIAACMHTTWRPKGLAKGESAGHAFRGNQWTGPISGEVHAAAVARRAAAAAIEPHVTSVMKQVAGRFGGRLVGLANRLKSTGSLARKTAQSVVTKGLSPDAAAAQIGDSLRYTMQTSTENYTEMATSALQQLSNMGFEIRSEDVRNSWGEGNTYRGINVNLQTPDGFRFELQFHTPESFDLKEGFLHVRYAEARLPSTSDSRRSELNSQMVEASSQLPTPPGVGSIGQQVKT